MACCRFILRPDQLAKSGQETHVSFFLHYVISVSYRMLQHILCPHQAMARTFMIIKFAYTSFCLRSMFGKRHRSGQLSAYEKQEIQYYDEVYFCAPDAQKIRASPESTKHNSGSNGSRSNIEVTFSSRSASLVTYVFVVGYDDHAGNYLTAVGDHIAYRFEVVEVIGSGSFGKVFKV